MNTLFPDNLLFNTSAVVRPLGLISTGAIKLLRFRLERTRDKLFAVEF